MVKHKAVYGQIKAADKNTTKTKDGGKTSFRTRGFGANLDDIWPRYCRGMVLHLSRGVKALLQIEFTQNCSNVGMKNMLFSRQKHSREKDKTVYLQF